MLSRLLLLVAIFSATNIYSQINYVELATMPEPVTNNAVTQATKEGVMHVFSFAGIDSTKACGSAHLKSFAYNTETQIWTTIADLPDESGGVVAAGASTVKNKIYIVGGYHIRDNCTEVSSNDIHSYDPETGTYAKLADIPIPIDDHVQAVYNDSLLYVITGWSNSINVRQVQIYNPTTDSWSMGTPVPSDPEWRVFGASGTIFENYIYYMGGATFTCDPGNCFPPTSSVRTGIIDANDPTIIEWSSMESTAAVGYRMAALHSEGLPLWIGGSELTYNFDGIDYNGTGGVNPNGQYTYYIEHLSELYSEENVMPPIMDLRGIAKLDEKNFIICGGMEAGQKVTDKAFHIIVAGLVSNEDISKSNEISIYPTVVRNSINIESSKDIIGRFKLLTQSGQLVFDQYINNTIYSIDMKDLPKGVYIVNLDEGNKTKNTKVIKL